MSNFASRFKCRTCFARKAGGGGGGSGGSTFKIFIGNLSEKTTTDDLKKLFETHGTVAESFIVDGKHFGFIHMESEESRTAAVEALNGHCLHDRELTVQPSKSREAAGDGGKEGDWACSGCGFSNFASRFQCFKCKTGKDGAAADDSGDWNCQGCGFSNFASRRACFKCKCNPDGTPGDGGDEWACPSADCGFSNFSTRRSCYKCKTPNPNGGDIGGGAPARPGDWNCSSCSFSNFASRFECFKCKTPQGGGGKKITFGDDDE